MTSTSKFFRLLLTSMSSLIWTSSRPSGKLCLFGLFLNCESSVLAFSAKQMFLTMKSHYFCYIRLCKVKSYAREVTVQPCFNCSISSFWLDLNLNLFSADNSCGVSVCPVKPRRLTEWWRLLHRDTATATPVSSRALVTQKNNIS